ncbi:MAG: hypothetical protein WD889_02865 [Candidatus Colwellbacteria bacterium]
MKRNIGKDQKTTRKKSRDKNKEIEKWTRDFIKRYRSAFEALAKE